jgi:hypothetical protein
MAALARPDSGAGDDGCDGDGSSKLSHAMMNLLLVAALPKV